LPNLTARGKGVAVVVSPWNFPLAIPCGGVAAALAAGNTVILKPASDTVLIAYMLAECFWRAGVPRTALQFAPCSGGTVGQRLVTHDGVDAVILTGGTATAAAMLAAKPTMNLLAETGGKNATIVTALSDRDQAIKDVLHSAFSHSGQKCSATSLWCWRASITAALRNAVETCGPARRGIDEGWPTDWPPSGVLETGWLAPVKSGQCAAAAGRWQSEPGCARREVGRAAGQFHALDGTFWAGAGCDGGPRFG
jgi:acyl-CoA reductase-like NAD-dependent aldehyde dehydrogenase